MGLVSFFYNASNLVVEISKHDKICMIISISVPTPNYEGFIPLSPVIHTPMQASVFSLSLSVL